MIRFLATLLLSFSSQFLIHDGQFFFTFPSAQAQQPQFSCPLAGQSPVVTSGGANQFCTSPGLRGDCPQNSLCLASGNVANVFICCFSQTTVTPVCPNNGVPQRSTSNYVPCSLFSPSCDTGFTCVRAVNDFNIMLCCSSQSSTDPTCPDQQRLFTESGRPRFCLPSQPTACPAGYACQLSVGTTTTYVCCTVASAPTCPSQFTASLDDRGQSIFCSPSQPAGCPSGSVCLKSTNSESLFLCCRSAASPRVCPNNQNALLTPSTSVETCNGPGSPCSRIGYSCQFSSILAQYICCGMDPSNAICPNGLETFVQTAGQTYTCNIMSFPTGCPVGYDCLVSTIPNVNVCCLKSVFTTTISPPYPTDTFQCPTGWNPYRNAIDAQPRTCASPTDTGCPTGYSCTPSSIQGIFICCRLGASIVCPRGDPFLLNGQPRLCSRTRANQCPRGYTCEQSTSPTITICCSIR